MSLEHRPQQPNQDVLDFIVPFDGARAEVDQSEREIVSQKFQALLNDTLLNHAGQVNHYELGSPCDTILLRKEDEKHLDTEWSLHVEQKTDERQPSDEWEPAEQIQAEISIRKIEKGLGRDGFSYRLGSDGVVRRYDLGDGYQKAQQQRVVGAGQTAPPRPGSEAWSEYLQGQISEIVNVAVPNARLARQMGVNDQPISLQELEGLENFVVQPGFEVPATLDRKLLGGRHSTTSEDEHSVAATEEEQAIQDSYEAESNEQALKRDEEILRGLKEERAARMLAQERSRGEPASYVSDPKLAEEMAYAQKPVRDVSSAARQGNVTEMVRLSKQLDGPYKKGAANLMRLTSQLDDNDRREMGIPNGDFWDEDNPKRQKIEKMYDSHKMSTMLRATATHARAMRKLEKAESRQLPKKERLARKQQKKTTQSKIKQHLKDKETNPFFPDV